MSVQLQLLDKADKEISKLPRAVKGAIYDFQRKFRDDPDSPGLRFKRLQGNAELYSARVTDDYRALLLRVTGTKYLLIAVKPRGAAYDNLERYAIDVNKVSGGIEYVDVVSTAEFLAQVAAARGGAGQHGAPQRRQAQPPASGGEPYGEQAQPAAPQAGPVSQVRLFAGFSSAQLLELGVAEPLLPLIAKISTEEELLGLAEFAPSLTTEVLFALHDGKSPEEVLEQVTAPVRADGEVDITDFAAALNRPATLVSTDDAALQAVLQDDFARWQVFLHPAQRKLVERSYNGPARVSGGPGTGKTIVALHRVAHLAKALPPGDDRDILFTTFTTNLAADLRSRLLELADRSIADRVEVTNIDALATKIVGEAEPGTRRRIMDDSKAVEAWETMLLELGVTNWDAQFLHDEWSQVILGQALADRDEYFRARRAGRGRTLNRVQRAEIWRLVEQFTKRLRADNQSTFRQVAAEAARIARGQAAANQYRYQHIVIDEAQDLSPAHWLLLRALVPEDANDLFLAGDTHQRIYDSYASLGSLGINIRGRSTRLTLSYRSTHQILATAEALLGRQPWDDLDGGTDTLAGYRSVLRGPRPELDGYATWAEELTAMTNQVREWLSAADGVPSIAVAVPTRRLQSDAEAHLRENGLTATTLSTDGPRDPDAAIHIGTLHRFKGLEYQQMLVAAVSDGLIPDTRIATHRDTDPTRYDRELKQARSLLFVAATRARDRLTITWHGTPSPFLPLAQ